MFRLDPLVISERDVEHSWAGEQEFGKAVLGDASAAGGKVPRCIHVGAAVIAGREIERIANVAFAQIVDLPQLGLGKGRIEGCLLGEGIRKLDEHLQQLYWTALPVQSNIQAARLLQAWTSSLRTDQ